RRHTRFSRDWSSDVCSSDLALLHILAELAGGRFQLLVVDDQGLARQMVKKLPGLFAEKQWQVIFNTSRSDALTDVGVDRAGFRVLLKKIKPARFEGADGAGVERKFPCRQNADGIHFFQGAL